MINFISMAGALAIILGLAGGIFFWSSDRIGAGIVFAISSAVSGSLLIGFSKLLEWVRDIRDALIDEALPIEEFSLGGGSYRIKPIRKNGKYGGTFQVKGGEPVSVDPTYATLLEFREHVRKLPGA